MPRVLAAWQRADSRAAGGRAWLLPCAQAEGQASRLARAAAGRVRAGDGAFHERPRCRPPAGGAPRGPGGLRRRARPRAQERGQADLAERLPRAVGWGMGLEFRESQAQLTAENATPARPGMVFNVTLGARPGRGAPARPAPPQPTPSECSVHRKQVSGCRVLAVHQPDTCLPGSCSNNVPSWPN